MMDNGSVQVIATTIHYVMSSESKAEVSALFINKKEGIMIQNHLKQLGHQLSANQLQTDN